MTFAALLFGTAQQPDFPVTRHVRLAHMPVKPCPIETAKKDRLAKARLEKQARLEASNNVPADQFKTRGKHTGAVYSLMVKTYPEWITAVEIMRITHVAKSALSNIFLHMGERGHLEKRAAQGVANTRAREYRLVMK